VVFNDLSQVHPKKILLLFDLWYGRWSMSHSNRPGRVQISTLIDHVSKNKNPTKLSLGHVTVLEGTTKWQSKRINSVQ